MTGSESFRAFQRVLKNVEVTRADYIQVAMAIEAARVMGKGSIFERGSQEPITHLSYFKPPKTAFLAEPHKKTRRYAKEWEYLNAAGVWGEVALTALAMARDDEKDMESFCKMLAIAEQGVKASLEVLTMRAQFFMHVADYGVEFAREMASIVEHQEGTVSLNRIAPAEQGIEHSD